MIKKLHRKKLNEIIGKPGPLDPEHIETHLSDKGSPNQYLHRMKTEARVPISSGGSQSKLHLAGQGFKIRVQGQKRRGNQNNKPTRYGYTAEEEDLGPTETGKSGEKIAVNPTVKDSTGLNNSKQTVKETKEK